MKKSVVAFLLGIGLLQMAGDVLKIPAIKGIGAATVASPAPKVFSAVKGLETYSSLFFLEWTDRTGKKHSLPLTSDVYSKIKGPYNRRNVYGAVLAYGPVLSTTEVTKSMYASVMRFALCGEAPLLKELGIDPTTVDGTVKVRLEPLPGTDIGDFPRVLEPPCS